MNLILLLAAIICFLLDAFKASVGDGKLIAWGLAFLSASFLVGPVSNLVRNRQD